jgi:hypothetical protein
VDYRVTPHSDPVLRLSHAEANVLDDREAIEQSAHRWAELMQAVALRGRVFAEGEQVESRLRESTQEDEKGPKPKAMQS